MADLYNRKRDKYKNSTSKEVKNILKYMKRMIIAMTNLYHRVKKKHIKKEDLSKNIEKRWKKAFNQKSDITRKEGALNEIEKNFDKKSVSYKNIATIKKPSIEGVAVIDHKVTNKERNILTRFGDNFSYEQSLEEDIKSMIDLYTVKKNELKNIASPNVKFILEYMKSKIDKITDLCNRIKNKRTNFKIANDFDRKMNKRVSKTNEGDFINENNVTKEDKNAITKDIATIVATEEKNYFNKKKMILEKVASIIARLMEGKFGPKKENDILNQKKSMPKVKIIETGNYLELNKMVFHEKGIKGTSFCNAVKEDEDKTIKNNKNELPLNNKVKCFYEVNLNISDNTKSAEKKKSEYEKLNPQNKKKRRRRRHSSHKKKDNTDKQIAVTKAEKSKGTESHQTINKNEMLLKKIEKTDLQKPKRSIEIMKLHLQKTCTKRSDCFTCWRQKNFDNCHRKKFVEENKCKKD
ncbi:hypothetical protein MHBO_001753 [Bonamia ostreae]|uniref:Uncharacterized protein n=1 Tax=Bonamia ostreae TaxID=126728 RepID=A0ABV2AKP8_9EUKA